MDFFDVVKLGICTGQKEEEDFCTVVYDFSNQLSKLLYQLYDEISSDNKKDESAYKKEAYNKAENIRDKRSAVYGAENLNKTELRASRGAIIKLRKQAEDIELQSVIERQLAQTRS